VPGTALLALVLVAVTLTASSGAKFTGRATNPGQSFAAGSLSITNSRAGLAVVTAANLRPGRSATGTVTLTNPGLASQWTLTGSALTNTPASPALSSALQLTVAQTTPAGPTVYSGTFGGFASAGALSLGTFAAGAARTYTFTVSWPATPVDPTLQGASTSVTASWRATT
jgi:hypothetical protein